MLYILGFFHFNAFVDKIVRIINNFYHHTHHNLDMSIVDSDNQFATYRVSSVYSFEGKLFATVAGTDDIIEIVPSNNVLITGA